MIRVVTPVAHALSAQDAVLSVLAASPHHEMRGKKRFHKVTFLCSYCEAPIAARFTIRQFGVFSNEVAGALDMLTTFGDLGTRDEQIGPNGYFVTVFSLPDKSKYKPDGLIARVVERLVHHSTPTLEVASTVAFFMTHGQSEAEAVKETKRIKPDISTADQFAKTRLLLKELASLRASIHGQRSKNP
jgi:hypothetical protein